MADEDDTLIAGDDDMGDTDVTQVDGARETVIQGDQPTAAPRLPDMKIVRELGRGGMGVVYEGRQVYVDRRVAVKVLLNNFTQGSSQYADRFQREAKILARLQHPHIVACYQAGVCDEGGCYLVMEFIEGSNLEEWLCKHGVLSINQALGVIQTIALALQYAHQNGIIHRDVKPENILLGTEPSGELPFTPKLVDLGLARPDASGDMQLTAQGVIMGTPATMAPEQFDDPDHVDLRADIYGLGCVLYQALCAEPAFCGKGLTQLMESKLNAELPDPRAINPNVPVDVCRLVQDMLARDPNKRIQDYDQLLQRIATLQPQQGVVAGARPGSLLPLLLAVMVVGILAVVLVPALFTDSTSDSTHVENGTPAQRPAQAGVQPLEEQDLIGDGLALASWWQSEGNWGRGERPQTIVGFAGKGERARLKLNATQIIQRLDAVIGAQLDEGKSAAFDVLEVHVYFADHSEWKIAINDWGPSLSLSSSVPRTSNTSDDASTLAAPRKWPLTLQQTDDGWQLDLAAFRQLLRGYRQQITAIELCVSNGNCFIQDAVLNRPD